MPMLPANRIVQIGIRSVDAIEKKLVVESGMLVYDMRRIDELRMRTVMEQALAQVAERGVHLHVSFDVDFLDPSIAPGVPSTVPGGPTYREAQLCMEMIYDSGLMGSLDVMELNPAYDEGNRTAELAVELVQSLFGLQILARTGGVAGQVHSMSGSDGVIAETERFSAPNYSPLPVVVCRGEGVWVWDVDGRRYLDCISAYSSLNHGHRHPRIVAALVEQAGRLTLTSRAVHNDQMGAFLERALRARGLRDGAADEHRRRGRRDGHQARAQVGLSRERRRAGPRRDRRLPQQLSRPHDDDRRVLVRGAVSRGLRPVHAGLQARSTSAISRRCARRSRPIPSRSSSSRSRPRPASSCRRPAISLRRARCAASATCCSCSTRFRPGLGRTGKMFAHEHEPGAEPDMLVLGKALGGGVYPVSAVLASRAIMTLLRPGDHGSTFGGNPLAAAVGRTALRVLVHERLAERAAAQGEYLFEKLRALKAPCVAEIRGRGLLVGIEIAPPRARRARTASGCSSAACWRRTRTRKSSGSRRR